MLFIENIDTNSFQMYGDIIQKEPRIYAKHFSSICVEPVAYETVGRISIYSTSLSTGKYYILQSELPENITLDGTVYATCAELAIAFNTLMASGGASAIIGAIDQQTQDLISALKQEYNNITIDTLEAASKTIPLSTVHIATVMVEAGSVDITIAGVTSTLIQGMTVSFTPSELAVQDILINAAGGKCIIVTAY